MFLSRWFFSLYPFYFPFRIACRRKRYKRKTNSVLHRLGSHEQRAKGRTPRRVKATKGTLQEQTEVFQDAICRINLRKAQDKGLECWQTRSNAIILYDPAPADCVERVAKTTNEILCQKVSCVPRPPRNQILMATWQVQRDNSHQRGSSTGEPLADEAKKELKN